MDEIESLHTPEQKLKLGTLEIKVLPDSTPLPKRYYSTTENEWRDVDEQIAEEVATNYNRRSVAVTAITDCLVHDGQVDLKLCTMCVPYHGILYGVLHESEGYDTKEVESMHPQEWTTLPEGITSDQVNIIGAFSHHLNRKKMTYEDSALILVHAPEADKDKTEKNIETIIADAISNMGPALETLQKRQFPSETSCRVYVVTKNTP